MKYNVYIKTFWAENVIELLAQDQLNKLVEAYLIGSETIFLKNKNWTLKNLHELHIFEVADIVNFTRIWNNNTKDGLMNGPRSIPALFARFGTDVTEKFIQDREYGELKDKKYSFSSPALHGEIWSIVHPRISAVSKDKCLNGYYADAVESAFKELNDIIKIEYKSETGIELDGKPLMQRAFTPNSPTFKLADLSDVSGMNVQEGYMSIFAGSITGIRNPKAHKNLTITEEDAIEKIILASHLLKCFENRVK